jgi:hypothetical protein
VKAGAEHDNMPFDLHAGLGFRRVHVGGRDLAEIGNVAHVEADRLPHEEVERHFVDRKASRFDVPERVHVGADVVDHAEEIRLECHGVARNAQFMSLRALVTHVDSIDRTLKKLVPRHVVFDEQRQIDGAAHGLLLSISQARIVARSFSVAETSGRQGKPLSAGSRTTP